MDYAHDFIADVIGADKGNLAHSMLIMYTILATGGIFFYLVFASLSFYVSFIRNKTKFFPSTINETELYAQVKHEIWIALSSIPLMAVVMLPGPLFSYRGYSKMYKNVSDYGWPYFFVSIVCFFVFTDCVIYWFHRGLHHPLLYKRIHKLHHTYRYTTPFSSHAFHPLDGFGQGVPYYAFVYLFPFHDLLFIAMFLVVNFWTISIHDQIDLGGSIINTTGHHTIHHEQFSYNYGQYFTIWDRIAGTYKPAAKTHKLL